MKKLICLFLAILMLTGSMHVLGEEETVFFDDEEESVLFDGDAEDELANIELVPYDYDDITIGNPTPLNGQFFTSLWGNATSDIDVRHLVTGYNLIVYDTEISQFRFDRSVVSGAFVSDDQEGNRSYLLSLYSDLYYSDGTPITAWDYAFSILLQCSPLIKELGGRPAAYDYLVGYEDYVSGAVPYISGLRVPAEDLLIITVKAESLPYFYELSHIAFEPCPIRAIAPGCAVQDEGNGAFIAGENEETAFTADLLRSTILGENGYQVHPDPVSGPYQLISYDGQSAVFEINPYFKGNEAGKKPRIKRLTYTCADNGTMIQELGEGKYALLNKVTYGDAISSGLALCVENPQYTRSTYPRIGLTYILFNPQSDLVQEQKVRQAIALCLDTPEFISSYVGNFGIQMEELAGLGQWMYNAVSGTMAYPLEAPENPTPEEEAEYEAAVEAWDALSLDGLTRYALDPEQASALLEEAGWTLNEQGGAFDPEKDGVRCKEINGELRKLQFTMGYQTRADVEEAFAQTFIDHLAQAGIGLTLKQMTFDSVVDTQNEYAFDGLDLVYLGDNFTVSFEPAALLWEDILPAGPDDQADSLNDVYQELYALADDMDHTEPKDILGYMQKWVLFQERFSELLPLIPVYSNIYFDFYTRELDEYWIEENISWGKAIVAARMRSIKTAEEDLDILEAQLSYAGGNGDLDLNSLLVRPEHEAEDYSAGPLSRFPKDVRSQVPEDYRNIYEFVAANVNRPEEPEDAEETAETETDAVEMVFRFQTPYEEGETVYVLFGIPSSGSDVDWFVREGAGLEDGSVGVILEQEQLEQLYGHTFALAVVSR